MAKPNDPNAPENAVDWNRYYLRPGTTEPELRPEFANEAVAEKPAAAPEAKTEPKPAAKKPVAKKK